MDFFTSSLGFLTTWESSIWLFHFRISAFPLFASFSSLVFLRSSLMVRAIRDFWKEELCWQLFLFRAYMDRIGIHLKSFQYFEHTVRLLILEKNMLRGCYVDHWMNIPNVLPPCVHQISFSIDYSILWAPVQHPTTSSRKPRGYKRDYWNDPKMLVCKHSVLRKFCIITLSDWRRYVGNYLPEIFQAQILEGIQWVQIILIINSIHQINLY